MEFTGERFMPLLGHPGVKFHNERYEFAALFCHGKSVLEIGCGAGYGAAILAEGAVLVDAFDYSQEAIEYCKEHYPVSNITFYVDDICNYRAYGRRCYDVVVAYEVLEHIEDGDVLMQLIKELLPPSGVALISTPAPPAHGSSWHKREYNRKELKGLLAAHFQKHVVISQRPWSFAFHGVGAHTYIGVAYGQQDV